MKGVRPAAAQEGPNSSEERETRLQPWHEQQHPHDAQLSVEELETWSVMMEGEIFFNQVLHYAASLCGTRYMKYCSEATLLPGWTHLGCPQSFSLSLSLRLGVKGSDKSHACTGKKELVKV